MDIASAVSSARDVAGNKEDTRETSIDFSLVFAVAFCCRCSLKLLLLETLPERRRKGIKSNEKTVIRVLVVIFVVVVV